jgi:Ribbon-helix-helix protein, copG family
VKPRIGIHLSEQMAARLATAAERPGVTRSALVEAALELFFDSDGSAGDAASVTQLLGSLTRQLETLSSEVRAVKEIVALHARFDLAMAPMLPAEAQSQACKRGSARFDEFATQVQRRLQSGRSLLQETVDCLSATERNAAKDDSAEGPSRICGPSNGSDPLTPNHDLKFEQRAAAVREDGSRMNFPGWGIPLR